MVTQPLVTRPPASDIPMGVSPSRLETHVRTLSETLVPRSCAYPANLDRAAAYIAEHLARLLGSTSPPVQVELVAYSLEEPPFFRTPYMGSAVHAVSLKQQNVRVRAMFSLEMIGYFTDAPNSQRFPPEPELPHLAGYCGNAGLPAHGHGGRGSACGRVGAGTLAEQIGVQGV
jgi:hypothetical protein